MTSTKEAKKRLVVNIGTNILSVAVAMIIGIWMTPYLIRKLGLEVYGMIPLVLSFIQYFSLFTVSISAAVSKFVSICLNKNDIKQSNIYFNSAFISIVLLSTIMLIPVLVMFVFFSKIFHVPEGYESDTGIMFFYIMLSSFFFAIATSFQVSTFVTHRFDIHNLLTISSRLLRVMILFLCFTYIGPSLKYFGLSYGFMALFFLLCSIVLTKVLTPQLRLCKSDFDWQAIREMAGMSGWIAVNQVGALLYLGVTYILINVILGPEQVGRYGAIAQLALIMGQLGAALSNIFAPIAYDYIARGEIDVLIRQMRRSTKFMALIMALPIGILCGLVKPVLELWLGSDFIELDTLVWLLIAPWIVTISIKPLFAIYRGFDKVKVPAIVTLVLGVINLALCFVLLKFTNLGIHGVAWSLLICLAGKNLIFSPIYAAVIVRQPKTIFIRELFPGIAMLILTGVLGVFMCSHFKIDSIMELLLAALCLSGIYSFLAFVVILNREDKRLLWSLVFRRN